jgi:ribosomal protein S19
MSRSKWKGPSINSNTNLKNEKSIKPRHFEITSNVIGYDFNIHTGNSFVKIKIIEDMIGHKAGEFVPTRKKFIFKKKKKKK